MMRRLPLLLGACALCACSALPGGGDAGADPHPAVLPEKTGNVRHSSLGKPLFGGNVYAWATLHPDRSVAEVAAHLPFATINNARPAPSEGAAVLPGQGFVRVDPPASVKDQLPVGAVEVGFQSDGADAARFSVRFLRAAPVDVDCENPPAIDADLLPRGFVLRECLPGAGIRATDGGEDAISLGFAADGLTFIEASLPRERLLRRREVTLEVPALRQGKRAEPYPKRLQALYDEASQAYDVVLDGWSAPAP